MGYFLTPELSPRLSWGGFVVGLADEPHLLDYFQLSVCGCGSWYDIRC